MSYSPATFVINRTATIASQGTITLQDNKAKIFMNTATTGSQNAHLPAGAPANFEVIIFDDTGLASNSFPLLISALDGALINGSATIEITTPFGTEHLIANTSGSWRLG